MNQLLIQWTHPEFSSIEGFKNNLLNSPYCGSSVETSNWTKYTIQSWNESIYEGFRRPSSILKLGLRSLLKAFRRNSNHINDEMVFFKRFDEIWSIQIKRINYSTSDPK